ncbi:hypothetical protein JXA12_04175 [Candidatus Woesearchaeota archaeon]|nr:hypothetical protein [Candidatus Woesearchaeota archaeon]
MAQFDEPKGKISIIVGLIVLALAAIPLLNGWGVIGFNLPDFIVSLIPAVAIWALPALALFLFIDAVDEDDAIKTLTIILGIVFLIAGVIQILNSFGVLGFGIPFLGRPVVAEILLGIEGLFLIIATFAMN